MSGELDKERSKLISALKNINTYEPTVARNDIASHLSPLVDSINKVNECDICVVLLKYNYGTEYTEENPKKLSYTHREYIEARDKKKYPHVYIYNGKSNSSEKLVEKKREPRLKEFIKEIQRNHICGNFSGVEDLVPNVLEGLQVLLTDSFKNNLRKQKDITRNEILEKAYFKKTIEEFDNE